MKAVCLVDTSILLEILNVPGKAGQHEIIIDALERKIANKESLLLPMATIFETGRHLSQCEDGSRRRKVALEFVDFIQNALEGKTPFSPVEIPAHDDIRKWLTAFPDEACRGVSLADVSIIHDWERQCTLNKRCRVYIWSLDKHLQSRDRNP